MPNRNLVKSDTSWFSESWKVLPARRIKVALEFLRSKNIQLLVAAAPFAEGSLPGFGKHFDQGNQEVFTLSA